MTEISGVSKRGQEQARSHGGQAKLECPPLEQKNIIGPISA